MTPNPSLRRIHKHQCVACGARTIEASVASNGRMVCWPCLSVLSRTFQLSPASRLMMLGHGEWMFDDSQPQLGRVPVIRCPECGCHLHIMHSVKYWFVLKDGAQVVSPVKCWNLNCSFMEFVALMY